VYLSQQQINTDIMRQQNNIRRR